MKVILIGCGLSGGAIAFDLLRIRNIRELALYSRTLRSAKALAFDLSNSKVKVVEKIDNLNRYDYVILALSGMSDSIRAESMFNRKTTYEVRQDELKYNIGAIAGLIPHLRKIKEDTKIIVVTNPVDEIVDFLIIKLKNKNVCGFGLELDARRYSNVLGKKVFCIGTHGKAIPLINLPSTKDYDSLYKKIDSELMSYIRRNGLPHNAAGKVFSEFFLKLTGHKIETVHVSAYIKNEFCGVKDVSISLPFIVKEGRITGVSKVSVSKIEKQRFQKSARQLKKSVRHILNVHKKLVSYK